MGAFESVTLGGWVIGRCPVARRTEGFSVIMWETSRECKWEPSALPSSGYTFLAC
jgi:hypothetical protein